MTEDSPISSISVVIPAFNAESFVVEALDSVSRQTLAPLECIVIDDGSSDETAALASRHPACTICVSQPNRGVASARNAGAARAQGELLAFLDADDAWLPERLERMAERLRRERVQAVLCTSWLADERLNPQSLLEINPRASPAELLLGRIFLVSSSSNLLIQRDAFSAIGRFDESLSTSADWDLSFRILDQLTWAYEPEPLVLYRRHSKGMSRDIDRMASEMLQIYRKIYSGPSHNVSTSRRKAFGSLHRMLAGSYYVEGRVGTAARHLLKSLVLAPSEAGYFAAALGRRLRKVL